MNRFDVLEAATATVAEREDSYGSPKEMFDKAAVMTTLILEGKLKDDAFVTVADVVLIMALAIKGSRLIQSGGTHVDSQVDLAGYASLLSEVTK